MAVNMDKLNAFVGQFVGDLGAAVHAGMVVIGEKLGLYKALAEGPLNSAELATKTKTDERYVREWLGSQAAVPQFGGDIMKRILCLAVTTIAICLITTSAQARSNLKLRFNIPFSFTVRNTTFPAGEYEITEPSHWFLELRNLKNKVAGFEHVQSAQSRDEANGRVRLIFHQYDNKFFLAVLSDGSWQSKYEIQTSKV